MNFFPFVNDGPVYSMLKTGEEALLHLSLALEVSIFSDVRCPTKVFQAYDAKSKQKTWKLQQTDVTRCHYTNFILGHF